MADNSQIDIQCMGKLEDIFELVFTQHSHAIGYRIEPAQPALAEGEKDYSGSRRPRPIRLIFYWAPATNTKDGYTAFPFKMDAKGAADFARRWLDEQAFGDQPDHDGDNSRSWRVYNEGWGHVGGDWAAFLAVEPCWAMYGK